MIVLAVALAKQRLHEPVAIYGSIQVFSSMCINISVMVNLWLDLAKPVLAQALSMAYVAAAWKADAAISRPFGAASSGVPNPLLLLSPSVRPAIFPSVSRWSSV